MKKKILFVAILLILTGCSAEYNLNIKDDSFEETITALVSEIEEDISATLNENNQYVKVTNGSDLIYDKKISQSGSLKKYDYTHTYNYSEFQDSLSNKCFNSAKLSFIDGYYTLFAKDFNCFGSHEILADSYKITINTDYKVINTNADSVKNNKYIWVFNEKNYKNKSIIFQYSKKEIKNNWSVLPIVISLGSVLLTTIIIQIIIKFKQSQKMEV